jgi:hypothetical protein
MPAVAYKLAEYKIMENVYGDLSWECHFGLGSSKNGKCFVNGNILYLIPSENTGAGFLKGEFLDHLDRLPKWQKTKYYCTSYKIHECKSGKIKSVLEKSDNRSQGETNLRKKSTRSVVTSHKEKSIETYKSGDSTYKLYQYEVIKRDNGQLFWQSYGGLNRIKKGRCYINGNILFLEHVETERSGFKKKEFLQKLIQLPEWKRTKYYCTAYAVYFSDTGKICRSLGQDKDSREEVHTENDSVSKKNYRTGKKPDTTPLISIVKKDNLKKFFGVCKILSTLIMKLLVVCLRASHRFIKAIVKKLIRLRR